MIMTDPIADFLTRIRNAVRAHHKQVEIPASKMKIGLTEILYQQNFINGFSILNDTPQGTIRIYLRYGTEGAPVIAGLERISSPGLRRYAPVTEIPRTLNGLGVTIVSTPKGLLTDAQARQQNVGGEVLCRIW
ncbi:MAG: 30S ribosomal protein S8 [Bacteroidetes bacterium]|nr:30S ribosomal protein S8 [Bacteroidota bacterium]